MAPKDSIHPNCIPAQVKKLLGTPWSTCMSYTEVVGVRTGIYSVLVLSRDKKPQITTVMERD